MLRAAWGWLAGHQARADRILQPVVGRLLAIQGFLHSDDSPGLTMTVDDGGATFVGHDRAQGRATVRKILRQLTRTARATGFLPIAPMTQIGLPGKSFHSGGELPMRHHPGPMETDLLGRPAGTTRVHVVDSAVMPTIAGSTITFTEMANAHRIATASLAL
jgi:choline dehydrogenase-like flavoprotein